MKKLPENMDACFDALDTLWRELPLQKQYRYLMCCFLIYLALTLAVVLKVWYDFEKSNHNLKIEHIEKPFIEKKKVTISSQDSIN